MNFKLSIQISKQRKHDERKINNNNNKKNTFHPNSMIWLYRCIKHSPPPPQNILEHRF